MRNANTNASAIRKESDESWISGADPLAPDALEPVDHGPDIDELYRSHASRLARFFSRRTGSREEARDLVQEAFSRLLGLSHGRRAELDRPEAYLNRVTRNLLHDRAKTLRRRSAHLHVVADTEPLAGPDQQHLLETRDMLRRLEAAMLKLKPRTREIFMAHRLDGMSYAEIAERTGLSVKGVEKQMSKAIAHIDRLLDRQ